MTDVLNLRIPTKQMIRFLLFLYFNGPADFKAQNIYNNAGHFRIVTGDLLKWNVISKKKGIIKGRFCDIYSINGNGKIFIEEFIYDYHKCVTRS